MAATVHQVCKYGEINEEYIGGNTVSAYVFFALQNRYLCYNDTKHIFYLSVIIQLIFPDEENLKNIRNGVSYLFAGKSGFRKSMLLFHRKGRGF